MLKSSEMNSRCAQIVTDGTFSCLEFRNGKFEVSGATNMEQLFSRIEAVKSGSAANVSGLCMLFEDISLEVAGQLDLLLNIGQEFFHRHLAAPKFPRLNSRLKRNNTLSLPSKNQSPNCVHLSYKRLLEAAPQSPPIHYELRMEGRAERSVRHMPHMKDCCVSIADACFSILKKEIGEGVWISVMLMDPTSKSAVYDPTRPWVKTTQRPWRDTSSESRVSVPHYSAPSFHQSQRHSTTPSFLEETAQALLVYERGPSLVSDVSIYELTRHPVQIMTGEWILYSSLMGQFAKHYEISFETLKSLSTTETSNIMLELHSWRRRGQRSLEKLTALKSFVAQQVPQDTLARAVSNDINYISQQIVDHRQSLEYMVPMLISMVQLMDSRRAMEETIYVKRLTYVALIFLPLSFVASLFSMNEDFAVNSSGFKVYLATALPLLPLVLLGINVPQSRLWYWCKSHRTAPKT
ncbi:hypothetical protein P153DRAFT_401698 [Dothidotthia symphoricarpi CBS 119687]|uniref:Cora-domain-containing protein n=1 Tax=Dothidotthia symphoricarpi CBS 119687 TaxID=1392245 RepID=A0A6A5ZW35_9PLEO|nr:uncharacterized protein P153DRAFT_401698 [Dothidotthia symphoricarpi CBS 119687]KAF2123800.1 hypothetical protein P153DRAFT_401698 [Dothidotthia symphoricarpi CBS 119687]